MLSTLALCESVHRRQILSTDIDYFNRHVCTSSADGLVRIVDVLEPEQHPPVELREHVGPVWRVTFSHPKYGFLASCGSDCKLMLYATGKTTRDWRVVYAYNGHRSSVNSVDWAPHAAGAAVACASSDGCLSVHTMIGKHWSAAKVPNAHPGGANCVGWSSGPVNGRWLLASGGNDRAIKLWQEQRSVWVVAHVLDDQPSAVGDLSWCPWPGLQGHMVASCAADGRVSVWSSEDCRDWTQTEIGEEEDGQRRVSWSRLGNILSVASDNNVVKLWKQVDEKRWMCLDRKVMKEQSDVERQNKSAVSREYFASVA